MASIFLGDITTLSLLLPLLGLAVAVAGVIYYLLANRLYVFLATVISDFLTSTGFFRLVSLEVLLYEGSPVAIVLPRGSLRLMSS